MLSNPLAIVALLGGIVTLVTLSQFAARWWTHGISDVREVADSMRSMFGEVIAHGEVAAPDFMSEEARASETRLGDLRKRVRNRKLSEAVDVLMDSWKRTFANAPVRQIWAAWVGGDGPPATVSTDSPQRQRQVERQVQAAREGQVAVEAVLDRCNTMERWVL